MTLIGITTHSHADPDRAELDLLLDMIVRAVERAGGLPVLIPHGMSEATLRRLYARLDGLLFSGGGDVGPARYGAEMRPAILGVDAKRDNAELALARWVIKEEKPFFGICRGAQVLNVALGGTLYPDVSEHPGAGRHAFCLNLPLDLRPHAIQHEIQIEEDSTLARVIGQPIITVNSLHHQACREVAPGLRAAAHAPDGIIEAVEAPANPFGLAVQWHPECLPDAPEMRRLFERFVAACASRR
ncbi:MAG: gamma-glutamyl-gamma-aminobutyrate hydrolase family protein [Anaerolineales bacterium]